jgi:hypothetical protein
MMAEDRNVLINSEQNKKKYLPTELWDIVKSYQLPPPHLLKVVELKMKRKAYYNVGWGMGTFSQYPNLYRYLRDQKTKGNIDETAPNYYPDFLLVAKSRAKKAKEELAEYLREKQTTYEEITLEDKREMLYSKEPMFVRFRETYSKKELAEAYLEHHSERIETQFNDWVAFLTEVRPLLNL